MVTIARVRVRNARWRLMYTLAICLMGLSAYAQPGAPPAPPGDHFALELVTGESPDVRTRDGISLVFLKTADWSVGSGLRGFAATITLTNGTQGAIERWELQFSYPVEIAAAWNAAVSRSGDRFAVTPEEWNQRLERGQSRSFGFYGHYSGEFQEPTNYLLSGKAISEEAPAPPDFVRCSLATRFVPAVAWPIDGRVSGFVAEVQVTNLEPDAMNWAVALTTPHEITAVWNASFIRKDDRYIVRPSPANERVDPQMTRSFTIAGSYEGELRAPDTEGCPPESEAYSEMVSNWQARIYDGLSEEDKARVASGRLVWNGYDYSIPPTILMPKQGTD